jgi:hypothetical protein
MRITEPPITRFRFQYNRRTTRGRRESNPQEAAGFVYGHRTAAVGLLPHPFDEHHHGYGEEPPGSLTPEQKAKATFAFQDEERFNRHFIPRERKGLRETSFQKHRAHALLAAGLSQRGYIKVSTNESGVDPLGEYLKSSHTSSSR